MLHTERPPSPSPLPLGERIKERGESSNESKWVCINKTEFVAAVNSRYDPEHNAPEILIIEEDV